MKQESYSLEFPGVQYGGSGHPGESTSLGPVWSRGLNHKSILYGGLGFLRFNIEYTKGDS